jgi:hypothetical protein
MRIRRMAIILARGLMALCAPALKVMAVGRVMLVLAL